MPCYERDTTECSSTCHVVSETSETSNGLSLCHVMSETSLMAKSTCYVVSVISETLVMACLCAMLWVRLHWWLVYMPCCEWDTSNGLSVCHVMSETSLMAHLHAMLWVWQVRLVMACLCAMLWVRLHGWLIYMPWCEWDTGAGSEWVI